MQNDDYNDLEIQLGMTEETACIIRLDEIVAVQIPKGSETAVVLTRSVQKEPVADTPLFGPAAEGGYFVVCPVLAAMKLGKAIAQGLKITSGRIRTKKSGMEADVTKYRVI
ncbi:MAG: hypothetical protein M5U26_11620 [Planctomycetota bacterium]|nr:hypothetical protein [Planctomycetota bacterium]